MIKHKVTVTNMTGFDLQPVGVLCDTAVQFQSKIEIHYDNMIINAKSLLGVLGSGIKKGDEIEVVCDGKDEKVALKKMLKIIEDGLGE